MHSQYFYIKSIHSVHWLETIYVILLAELLNSADNRCCFIVHGWELKRAAEAHIWMWLMSRGQRTHCPLSSSYKTKRQSGCFGLNSKTRAGPAQACTGAGTRCDRHIGARVLLPSSDTESQWGGAYSFCLCFSLLLSMIPDLLQPNTGLFVRAKYKRKNGWE